MEAEQVTGRPWDASIAAALLAIIGVAAIIVPHESLIRDYPLAYNAVFGVGASILLYWVLIRLWLLSRLDRGPATLIAASVLLTLVGSIYTELWSMLVFDRPFQQPLDSAMAFVHATSGALLAVAFMKWPRIPTWLAWLLVVQVAVEVIEAATGIMLFGDLPVTAGGVLWTIFLGALAVVLITPAGNDCEQPPTTGAMGI